MNILADYLNGNVQVKLYSNGTKIIECPDDEIPEMDYPMSMDVKITNYCDLGCSFCHEMSTKEGKHGDLNKLEKLLRQLPEGTELAFGGGNPLDHPDLFEFFGRLIRDYHLVPSMTINARHIHKHKDLINRMINEAVVYGVGISINSDDFNFDIINDIEDTSNCVYHIITGVNTPKIFKRIKESKINKVLLLGYKTVGRGIEYNSKNNDQIDEIISEFAKYFTDPNREDLLYCFDNLAVEQLNMKTKVTEDQWENNYMGEDGQFTMYVDAVEQIFALSSTSYDRQPLGNRKMKDIFSQIKHNAKNKNK